MIALSIDTPGPKRDFTPVRLSLPGYIGAKGHEKEIDLHGFDAEAIDESTLRFFVINHRPPINSTSGKPLDAHAHGLNSTVEVFHLTRGTNDLKWEKTFSYPDVIKTPNRVAATGEGGFVATNDHLSKGNSSAPSLYWPFLTQGNETVHWSRQLELVTGGGSLAFCSSSSCHLATGNTIKHPNGLTRSHHDGLYYVPSSTDGYIRAYRLDPPSASPRKLRLVQEIFVGMPMDNLAVDANGAIWAAAFPKVFELLAGFDTPRESKPPSAVFRIERRKLQQKEGEEEQFDYHVEKVLEDRDGDLIAGTTTVVHDAKTGRLFMGGVFSPFITVCDRTKV
jgi:SMP-30/Gluconolactonase/LRE-like region